MIPYNIRFPQVTLAATAVFAALVTSASRGMFLTEIDFEGAGAGTSSHNEFGLYRVSTAGTTSTSATMVPVNSNHPASSGAAYSAYSAQPTKGAVVQNCPINGNGQRYNWKALPNFSDAIWVPPGGSSGGTLVADQITGTASIVGRFKVFEV
jgi:hypothetical protein